MPSTGQWFAHALTSEAARATAAREAKSASHSRYCAKKEAAHTRSAAAAVSVVTMEEPSFTL